MSETATRFFLPHVLARFSSLELLARSVVEGFVAGLHRRPYKLRLFTRAQILSERRGPFNIEVQRLI